MDSWHRWLADAILIVHCLIALFVIGGFAAVLASKWLNWRWTANPWFRGIHLLAVGVVVAQAWLGRICPLTVWEDQLRRRAGDPGYAGSFIGHWLHELLFYEAEAWVFTTLYTVFGILVLCAWPWGRHPGGRR